MSKKPLLLLLLVLMFAEVSSQRIYLSFRIDDYGIDSLEIYKKIVPVFIKYNIPLTIGVVPFKEQKSVLVPSLDSAELSYLKKLSGGRNEIALHGFSHTNHLNSKKSSSEFYDQPYDVQFEKIIKGKHFLDSLLTGNTVTFIPPWNSFDRNTQQAVSDAGFKNLSASRYGLIAKECQKITCLPYTCLLNQVEEAISKVDTRKDAIIIVLFHTYDFYAGKQNKLYESSNTTIQYAGLENLLSKISKNNTVHFVTLNELRENFKEKTPKNIYFNSYFLPVFPSFKLFEPLELKDLSFFNRSLFVIVPLVVLLFLIALAVLFYYISLYVFSLLHINLMILNVLIITALGISLLLTGISILYAQIVLFTVLAINIRRQYFAKNAHE